MSRRPHLNALAAISAAVLGALAGPALALASGGSGSPSGGASPSGASAPSGSTGSAGSTQQPSVGSANVTVTASGDGIWLATRSGALLRSRLRFSGSVDGARPGDLVEIERRGRETHWRWAVTAQATPASNGEFSAVWRTNHIGQFAIRALVASAGQRSARASTTGSSASPALTIIVYRPSEATLYGPGFYGRKTACGQRLTRNTIGLANRTLPCGTRVALEYDGRTLTVPVIDRGPYGTIADWDLTMATGRALGMPGTEWIGAVSVPGR